MILTMTAEEVSSCIHSGMNQLRLFIPTDRSDISVMHSFLWVGRIHLIILHLLVPLAENMWLPCYNRMCGCILISLIRCVAKRVLRNYFCCFFKLHFRGTALNQRGMFEVIIFLWFQLVRQLNFLGINFEISRMISI